MDESDAEKFMKKEPSVIIELGRGDKFDVLIKCLAECAAKWALQVKRRQYDAPEIRMTSRHAYATCLIQEILLNNHVNTVRLANKIAKQYHTFDKEEFRLACNYVEYKCIH